MKNCKKNKGFSLVELIVVIAVMAILVGVLAPAYLRYVDKSKLQKDISAIGEVIEAIKVTAAEPEVAEEIQDYDSDSDYHKTYVDIKANTGTIEAYRDPDTATADNLQREVQETIGTAVEFSNEELRTTGITLRVRRDSNYNVVVDVEVFDYENGSEVKNALIEAFPTYESTSKKADAAMKTIISAAEAKYEEYYTANYQTNYNNALSALKYAFWMNTEQKQNSAKTTAEETTKIVAGAAAASEAVKVYNTSPDIQEALKEAGIENATDLTKYINSLF